MIIDVYHRKNGKDGVYISGDLTGAVPQQVRLRTILADGKAREESITLHKWEQEAIEGALEKLNNYFRRFP